MKPKKRSDAGGGSGKRSPQAPPAESRRRRGRLPAVVWRLWDFIVGPPPKKAKRPQPVLPVQETPPSAPAPAAGVKEEAPMPDVTESTRQQPEEPARRAVEILARALTEAEAALTTPPPAPSEAPPSPEAEAPATSPEGTDALLRTLIDHFDRALDRLAEERRVLVDEVLDATRSLRSYVERVESRMDRDRELLTEKIAALAQAVERLEQRPAAETPPAAPPPAPEAQLPAAADETPTAEGEVFRPGEDSLTVVVSAVPGFQGLMEAQRALTRLPAVQGASVERYFNGEARIVLSLREPVSATRLAETLSEATGQETQVEEARPEALRLRVRFREPTD